MPKCRIGEKGVPLQVDHMFLVYVHLLIGTHPTLKNNFKTHTHTFIQFITSVLDFHFHDKN